MNIVLDERRISLQGEFEVYTIAFSSLRQGTVHQAYRIMSSNTPLSSLTALPLELQLRVLTHLPFYDLAAKCMIPTKIWKL